MIPPPDPPQTDSKPAKLPTRSTLMRISQDNRLPKDLREEAGALVVILDKLAAARAAGKL